ncbi:MAG: hypothetical protein AAB152_02115 [Candidatus Coatesbacteria bacterium]
MSPAGRVFVLTGLLTACVSWSFAGEAKENPNYCCLSAQGSSLSATAAEDLEKTVTGDPKDLASRILLIGYYSSHLSKPEDETLASILNGPKAARGKTARARLSDHMLWIIRHEPASEAAANLPSFDPDGESSLYRECKDEWLRQTNRHAKDSAVFAHAAKFLHLHDEDRDLAVALMRTARRLDPSRAAWALQLADIFGLQMRCMETTSAYRTELAGRAERELADALALDADDESRLHTLPDAAGAALEAGHPATASTYACEALAMAGKMKDNWYLPIALHKAWTVMGGIALAAGRTGEAAPCLLSSARITHNESSSWFDPDLVLAAALLARGERRAVMGFIELCLKWPLSEYESGQLKDLDALITGGRAPDFGTCLSYF